MQFERREAPFIRPANEVASMMQQVLYALVPAAIAYVWYSGVGFIFNLLVASIFCVLGEAVMLHLRGKPGAHVVIRTQPGQTPPLATLLAAANIALIQAKVPVGTAADIQYTRIKDVRSIPGDSGGRVRLANEKVLRVTRDPAALVGWTREG